MNKIQKKIFSSEIVIYLLYKIFLIYCFTFRIKDRNTDNLLARFKNREKTICCLWHQHIFGLVFYARKLKNYNPACMISASNDGDIASKFMQKAGWNVVRGSSSKGGKQALKTLTENKNYLFIANAADGPQGPIGKIKAGSVKIARETGAPVIPVYVTASRYWRLNSWDKLIIPKPFAKVNIIFGDAILFNKNNDSESFEKQLKYLEDIMLPHLIL
ncbi:MAG: lysophospholipid acyltransferase family protein [Deltaproteobacteria bacterium]|nr:lysophospholipid acyltransferase family protein [Deltaproteobacteria bacterium]